MSYKYEAIPSQQPSRRTPTVQACSQPTYSYQSYAAPSYPTAAPTKVSTPSPVQQHRLATHIPKPRVLPGTHSTQEPRFPNLPNTVNYPPAYVCPYHPSSRPDTPVSQTTKSGTLSSSFRAPSLSYSSGSEQGDASSLPRTPEISVLVPAAQIVFPDVLDNIKSCRNSPIPSLQPHPATYSTIEDIVYELNCSVLTFQRPLDLDFEPSSLRTDAVPRLAHTTKNRPLIEQNQKLERLREKLDAVKSQEIKV